MITSTDEAVLDSRESCSLEEAVAKLLGWMVHHWRSPLLVTKDGIDPQQLPFMLALPSPLDEFISTEREFASVRLCNAVIAGDFSAAELWEDRVAFWEKKGEDAQRYRSAIQAERNCRNSKLVDDSTMTTRTGEVHITLTSLDTWARRNFGLSVVPSDEVASTPKAEKGPKRPRTKTLQQHAAVLETLRSLGYDPRSLPPSPPFTRGVKDAVKKALSIPNPLFVSENRFDTIWERLRKDEDLLYAATPPK